MTEAEFQRQVTDAAELFGWSWVHFRPAQTSKGWRTPVSGPLGKGWPDLVLIRGERLIFAELKTDGAALTPEQDWVNALLAATAEVYVWRPADWPEIKRELR
jgi:hypothetical protein